MPKETTEKALLDCLQSLSSPFSGGGRPVAVILAAGQGKRIKSRRSKMLHPIWGEPTVARVSRAAEEGLESPDQVVVVGIKARDVAEALGPRPGRRFAYQAEQRGTGHAVQEALAVMAPSDRDRDVYVFPGDMGLVDTPTVRAFRETFDAGGADMLVMVGAYAGPPEANYYGRILRVPERDDEGAASGELAGRIIRIIEHKDILALQPGERYTAVYRDRPFSFTRDGLLSLSEYNSGLYAFRGRHLSGLVSRLDSGNAQGELYLTDLVELFNRAGLVVAGVPPLREEALLGFNDKAVLREMNDIARAAVWEKLKSVVAVADKRDFFIADDVVDHLLALDREGAAHDIAVGAGVFLGKGVRLREGVHVGRGAHLEGNIHLERNVSIGEAVQMSTFPGQTMRVGEGTRILKDDVLKGNITVGRDCLIEAPVRLTGSDEDPLVLGDGVRIKGDTYVYGSRIEAGCFIVNCILRRVRVERRVNERGETIPVCYIFPEPSGRESLSALSSPCRREENHG